MSSNSQHHLACLFWEGSSEVLENGLVLHKGEDAVDACISTEKQQMYREPYKMDLCHHQCHVCRHLNTEVYRLHFNL